MNEKFKVIKGIRIDPRLFTFKFHCNCQGECCHYGVYTDLKEHQQILRKKESIIHVMDESQTKNIDEWFEPVEKDSDFKSGFAVGTEVVNNKCAFLDKNGLCSLQKIAIQEGVHKWKYKPLYCILFPLTIFEGMITIDDEHIERLRSCNNNGFFEQTIFDACREELLHLFGNDGFEELELYREEYLSQIQLGVSKNE
jgi:Fe-S-cluster containining protein